MEKSYIGVDLGGTKLLLGEMDRQGNILRTQRFPSGALNQAQAMELMEKALDSFLQGSTPGYTPCAIGFGIVGRVDSRTGTWFEIHPGNSRLTHIGPEMEARYGLPCFADNDVRSATKAEMLFGNGKGIRHMIYINIGTGLAAGFVSDGRLVTGGHCNAGEVGHTASGLSLHVPCGCGRPDCVERVTAGVGLDASARLLHKDYPDTKLPIPETGRVKAQDIFALCQTDELCRVLTDNAAQGAANLIMNLIRFNDPERIVLGGGVLTDGTLFPKILEKLNPETIRFIPHDIVLTALDTGKVGLLGACSNAIIGMEERT